MKALVFDGQRMSFDENYETPKNDESLVKVNLAGICGTDLEILRGYMSYKGILGHEFVGTVVKSKNKELIGKRVVGEINVGCQKCEPCEKGLERHCPNRTVLGILNRNGGFAEYLSLPEKNLHVLPDSISDEQAVFIEPLAAAYEILEQVKINSDSKIAIVGDGRLAQLIVRVLKLSCKDITCFGKHLNKLDKLEKLGIKIKTEILENDKKSFDIVVEATGRESGLLGSMELVKPRGIIVLKSTIVSKNKFDLSYAIIHEITFVGSRCGPFRPAINALSVGLIQVHNLIDCTYPLEKHIEAFSHAQKSNSLKVLLKP